MTDNQGKFPEELRTFETRLRFIQRVFENLFPQRDILAHCVTHKLNKSYLAYEEELKKSVLYLTGEDPLKVLKHIE